MNIRSKGQRSRSHGQKCKRAWAMHSIKCAVYNNNTHFRRQKFWHTDPYPDPTRSKLLTWRSGDRVPSLVSRSRDHQVVTAVIADFTYSHNYSRRSCILLVLHVEIYLLLIVHASVYLLLYSVITAYEGAFWAESWWLKPHKYIQYLSAFPLV